MLRAAGWDGASDRSGDSACASGLEGACWLRQTAILSTRFARSWARSPVSLAMQALQYGVAAALMGEQSDFSLAPVSCMRVPINHCHAALAASACRCCSTLLLPRSLVRRPIPLSPSALHLNQYARISSCFETVSTSDMKAQRMLSWLLLCRAGAMYYRLPSDVTAGVYDRVASLWFVGMVVIFMSGNSALTISYTQKPLLRREVYAGHYRYAPYYMAKTLTTLPLQLAYATLYVLMTYFLVSSIRSATGHII